VFVVLHGQTEWNREGKVQGHSNSPLTDEGRQQARVAAGILRERVDPLACEIICSPLGRTRDTAQIVVKELGLDRPMIRIEDSLKEVSLGSWEGLTRAQVEARWPDRLANSDRYNWYFRSPDGESHDDLIRRLKRWLAAVTDHDHLIIVTHGVASRVLCGLYAGHPADDALKLELRRDAVVHLSNGGIGKLVATASTSGR